MERTKYPELIYIVHWDYTKPRRRSGVRVRVDSGGHDLHPGRPSTAPVPRQRTPNYGRGTVTAVPTLKGTLDRQTFARG